MAKNEKRVHVTLACEVCKRRNYITTKNKQNDRERIEMKKYCRFDRQHTLHKETRLNLGVSDLAAHADLAGEVDLAKRGDRAAFERLVRATSGDCYALALRLTGNEDDASDVFQETYLRAFRSLRRFRGDATFATWLHRITVNCSATLVARRRRTSHDELDDDLEVPDGRRERDPETAAATADDRTRLVAALEQLPEAMRMVVVLRDVYDLPHESIAKQLGISQTAAKVRLHRARRRLREQMFAPVGAPTTEVPSLAAHGRGGASAVELAPVAYLPLAARPVASPSIEMLPAAPPAVPGAADAAPRGDYVAAGDGDIASSDCLDPSGHPMALPKEEVGHVNAV